MLNKILTAFLLLCSGCMNIICHTSAGIVEPYDATKIVFEQGVCIWWNESYQAHHPDAAFMLMYTYPVWIADIVLEAAADTLTYPNDAINRNRKREKTYDCKNRN